MWCLKPSTLLSCGAALLFVAGCGDATAPTLGELPTVITADITDIKLHSAVVGGEVTDDGGSAVTARGVVWSAAPDPTIAHHQTNEGGGTGSFTSVMTELESGQVYHVRAYATNDRGTAYGENQKFRTSQGTVTDIDGNEYEIVRMGAQWWMAENLRVTRYRNGDAIPTNLTAGEWEEADYGAYTIYLHHVISGLSSDSEVVDAYGKLYNWFTVDDPRGICPEGWYVPGEPDWGKLETYLVLCCPGRAGGVLKSERTEPASHPRWNAGSFFQPNPGTNDFGWSALPGGRALFDGRFSGIGTHGNWLSATQVDELHNWSRFLYYGDHDVIYTNYSYKQNGNSIRCFRNADDS